MSTTITRRKALAGVSSSLILPACVTTPAQRAEYSNDIFAHGVASGDPETSSVVLWTRVSGFDSVASVGWTVATDEAFTDIVASGRTQTDASRDYTVKVIANDLQPGRRYFYRFAAGGAVSTTGRTLTLAAGRLDRFVMAIASCSNYQFGHFNVYDAIAADDAVDLVVHLGDYLYEYDTDTYGGPIGQRIGRAHIPPHEMVTLDDYRQRHAQYKADAGSLAMHARHPLIATWDDHETTNNPWSGGAQNHQPEEGSWAERRAASLKAYYEWMPVRDPQVPSARAKLWRHYKFGDLLSLITLESRHTGRSEQINLGDYRDRLSDADAARQFYAEVVGDPSRRMLSAELEAFVGRELTESVAAKRPWRVIANQTILANVVAPRLSDDPVMQATRDGLAESQTGLIDMLMNFGDLELAGNMDAWDGYPAARERLYRLADQAGARDLLVITGDTHMFWQNRLFDERGQRCGLELGTSAVTSPGGFYQLGERAAKRFDELTMATNPSVDWVDSRYRGYVRLSLGREQARADYLGVSNIESRDYALTTLRSLDIARRGNTLDYV